MGNAEDPDFTIPEVTLPEPTGETTSIKTCSACADDHYGLPVLVEPFPDGKPSSRFVSCPKTGTRVWLIPVPQKASAVEMLSKALGAVVDAEENAARAKEAANVHRAALLQEVRGICAVIGLIPLSELDGILEPPSKPKARRKAKKAASSSPRTGGLHRGLPKDAPAPAAAPMTPGVPDAHA